MKKLLMVASITCALMLAASPALAKEEIRSAVISGGDLKAPIELTGNNMYQVPIMAMSFDNEYIRARPATDVPGKKALGPRYTLEVSALDHATSKVKYLSFVLYPFAEGGPLTFIDHMTTLFGQKLATGFYLADPSMTALLPRVGLRAPGDFGAAVIETGTASAETVTAGASSTAQAPLSVPLVPLGLAMVLVAVAIASRLRHSHREPVSV